MLALDEKAKAKRLAGMGESEQSTQTPASDSPAPSDESSVRTSALDALRDYVAGMNTDNFIVRAHRRTVENNPALRPLELLEGAAMTGALLDRITHHVSILEMNGDSYRLAQSRARKAG